MPVKNNSDHHEGYLQTNDGELLVEESEDEQLENVFISWLNDANILTKPTVVFQMWMQSEGKQTKAFKFGHNSALYRSLIGCFRCAIFHTLIEHSILLNPTGSIRENPDSENQKKLIESRAMGTGTVSPGRPTNQRRPLAQGSKISFKDLYLHKRDAET